LKGILNLLCDQERAGRMKGVEGVQMSERKYLTLLERKLVIPNRLSVGEAKGLFEQHSKIRRGYLQYEEFRVLMHNFYSDAPIDKNGGAGMQQVSVHFFHGPFFLFNLDTSVLKTLI
jgi:hypothetical protein